MFHKPPTSHVLDPSKTPPANSSAGPSRNPTIAPCSPAVAAERTRFLIGCYRKGDAADPAVYVTAVASVLARYPEAIVRRVTDPATGLPSRLQWLPTVAEVRQACDDEMRPILDAEMRRQRARDTRRLLASSALATPEERRRAVERWEAERSVRQDDRPAAETPQQALERLAADKDKRPLTVGAGLAAKLAEMTGERRA